MWLNKKRDEVVLEHDEIQRALSDLIRAKTGRQLFGAVHIKVTDLFQVGTVQLMVVASAELEYEPKPESEK